MVSLLLYSSNHLLILFIDILIFVFDCQPTKLSNSKSNAMLSNKGNLCDHCSFSEIQFPQMFPMIEQNVIFEIWFWNYFSPRMRWHSFYTIKSYFWMIIIITLTRSQNALHGYKIFWKSSFQWNIKHRKKFRNAFALPILNALKLFSTITVRFHHSSL